MLSHFIILGIISIGQKSLNQKKKSRLGGLGWCNHYLLRNQKMCKIYNTNNSIIFVYFSDFFIASAFSLWTGYCIPRG